jgi:hypothetical protein
MADFVSSLGITPEDLDGFALEVTPPRADLGAQPPVDSGFSAEQSVAAGFLANIEVNPEAYANARRLAQDLNLPPILGERDPKRLRSEYIVEQAQTLLKDNPGLRSFLQDPDNQKLVGDDLTALSRIGVLINALKASEEASGAGEFFGEFPGYIAKTFGSVAASANQFYIESGMANSMSMSAAVQGDASATMARSVFGLFGATETAASIPALNLESFAVDPEGPEAKAAAAYAQKYRAELGYIQDRATGGEFWPGVALGGATSLALMAPAIAASVVTGSPAAGLAIMGSVTFVTSYGEARDRGFSVEAASAEALFRAAIEVVSERIPLKFILGNRAAGLESLKGQLPEFLKAMGAEGLTYSAACRRPVL